MAQGQNYLPLIITVGLVLIVHDSHAAHLTAVFPPGLRPNGFLFSVFLFFGLIVPIAIHELGHLIAGLAQGFRFELFIIFLLGIKRTENGIKVFLNRNFGYMGGIAATTPIRQSAENRIKFARVVLAGPIASLFFAVICFLLLIFTRNMLWTFWLIAGATSLGLFFATTIPIKSGVFFSDRARFQRLISKGKGGESEEALIKVIAQTTIDNSCKNISLEDTHALQEDDEPFMRFWGHYYEYGYFKDNQELLKAEEVKSRLLMLKNSIPQTVWKALKLED